MYESHIYMCVCILYSAERMYLNLKEKEFFYVNLCVRISQVYLGYNQSCLLCITYNTIHKQFETCLLRQRTIF